jgi:hypothetical protein
MLGAAVIGALEEEEEECCMAVIGSAHTPACPVASVGTRDGMEVGAGVDAASGAEVGE